MNFTNTLTKASVPGLALVLAAFLTTVALALIAMSGSALGASGGTSVGGGGGGDGSRTADGGGNTSPKYQRLWDDTTRKQRRWARRTSECESGGDPNAIGGGGRYRGAFQFMKSTWRTSPKSPGGDPIRYTYKTQAVVAVKLTKRDGAGHWPVCG